MANLFFNLPVTPSNGIGAPVDVSATGRKKTVQVEGSFQGSVNVEISLDGGTSFVTIATFTFADKKVIGVAAELMRVRRSGVPAINPGLPVVDVSANDDGTKFAIIPAAPASVDTSALGNFRTVTRADIVKPVNIEISDDGVNWATCMTFQGAVDLQSKRFTSKFMRSTRPGTIAVGGINEGAGIDTDELVKASGTDAGPADFLLPKLQAGSGVSLTLINPGGNERVEIKADGSTGSDELVKVTGADSTSGLLDDKLVAGSGITKTVLNPGGDEDLEIKAEGLTTANIDTDDPITVRGAVNAEGVAIELARADHDHRLELEVEDAGGLVGARPAVKVTGSGGIAATVTDDGGNDRVNIDIDGSGVTGVDSTAYFWGNRNISSSTTTRFLTPGHETTASTLDQRQLTVERDGTVRRLFVRHNTAAGNGNNVTYKVRKNGVATGILVTLATGAVGQGSDLVNTVAVVAGDRLSIEVIKDSAIGGGNIEVTATAEVLY